MFKSPHKSRFFTFAATLTILCILALDTFGQCGIFFRRVRTWAFPVAKIHLTGATDMSGDGLPDLLLGEQGTEGLFTRARYFILRNNGGGNFGAPWATIERPTGIIFNDYHSIVNVDNDGRPDLLIMLGTSSIPTSFITYTNNGDGTFTQRATNSLGTTRYLTDINFDGFGDYVSQNSGGNQFRYNLGNGDGTFGPTVVALNHGGIPSAVDTNNDLKMDFLDTSHLHINNGDQTWGTTDISGIVENRAFWAFNDFNVDGKMDILALPTSGTTTLRMLTGTGTNFTASDIQINVDPSWIGYPTVGNFAGNSAPDIYFQPRDVNKKVLLTNDGAGNFTQEIQDGRIDETSGISGPGVQADFDNDGKIDRIMSNSKITNSHIMLPDVTSFTFLKQVCTRPGEPRIVDFDRSNTTDWSFWNPVNGDWSSRTNFVQNGPPVTNQTIQWGQGSFGDIPMPGDYDGDGITDRAVFRNSTGYWYIRRSSDAGWIVIPFGTTGDKPVAADYDGDTITDIAVWRPSDGVWHIWYMGTQQYAGFLFGSNGDKPAPADFDGDLKTDIAVYRPSTGAWYILRSTDGNWFGAL